jgi:hypothetical protein
VNNIYFRVNKTFSKGKEGVDMMMMTSLTALVDNYIAIIGVLIQPSNRLFISKDISFIDYQLHDIINSAQRKHINLS